MVPNRDGASPSVSTAEYYIFQSIASAAAPGTAAALNHQFSPSPLGVDLFAQFGTNVSVPLVGNFDPPVSPVGGLGDEDDHGEIVTMGNEETNAKPRVTITALDALAAETGANAPTNSATFRIARTGPTSEALSVDLVRGGTASIMTRDFTMSVDGVTLNSSRVVIPAAQSFVDIVVQALDDAVVEPVEQISFTLVGRSRYELDPVKANRRAAVSISDNEPTVTITAIDSTAFKPLGDAAADSATFRISRDGDLTAPLAVKFSLGGTASRNSHYRLMVNGVFIAGSTVIIPAGESSVDVVVVPLAGRRTLTPRSVLMTLTAGKGHRLDAARISRSAVISINDRNT